MSDRMRFWWRDRSAREQRLLLVMAALFAVTFLWLGLYRPLGDRLAQARERHGRAVLALADARAQADVIGALQRNAAPPPGMAVAELVKRAADDAGFAAAVVTPDGPARAGVAIGAVRAPAFFGWLDDVQRRYGLLVDRISVRPNSDATLSVDLALRARGS